MRESQLYTCPLMVASDKLWTLQRQWSEGVSPCVFCVEVTQFTISKYD
jgi:hypothetical protein